MEGERFRRGLGDCNLLYLSTRVLILINNSVLPKFKERFWCVLESFLAMQRIVRSEGGVVPFRQAAAAAGRSRHAVIDADSLEKDAAEEQSALERMIMDKDFSKFLDEIIYDSRVQVTNQSDKLMQREKLQERMSAIKAWAADEEE